jgi:hypothetical protein
MQLQSPALPSDFAREEMPMPQLVNQSDAPGQSSFCSSNENIEFLGACVIFAIGFLGVAARRGGHSIAVFI